MFYKFSKCCWLISYLQGCQLIVWLCWLVFGGNHEIDMYMVFILAILLINNIMQV